MSYCGQCYAQVPGAMTTAGFVPSSAAPSSTYTPSARQAPQATLPHQMEFSRWRKTDTTFGPVGRVSITLVIVLIAAFSIVSGDIFAIGPLCFILPPLVLRSVWAKGRTS
jgi:hypothetical protein